MSPRAVCVRPRANCSSAELRSIWAAACSWANASSRLPSCASSWPFSRRRLRVLGILLQELFDDPAGVGEVTPHGVGLRQAATGRVGGSLRAAQLLELRYRVGRAVSQQIEISESERRGA